MSTNIQGLPAARAGSRLPSAFRLLLIEDDPVQQTLIMRAAERAGLHVTCAASCAEAKPLIQQNDFSCVTLDLALEDGDGFELMEQLACADYRGPLIVISGAGTINRRIARHLARAFGIRILQSFPKPVDLAALRLALTQIRQNDHAAQAA